MTSVDYTDTGYMLLDVESVDTSFLSHVKCDESTKYGDVAEVLMVTQSDVPEYNSEENNSILLANMLAYSKAVNGEDSEP